MVESQSSTRQGDRGRRAKAAKTGGKAPALLTPWNVHDLRRTVATGLQRLGVRLEVTEAVLNHISGSRGGIAGVYQRHDWAAEKRAALDAWATYVRSIVEGGIDGTNVVKMPRKPDRPAIAQTTRGSRERFDDQPKSPSGDVVRLPRDREQGTVRPLERPHRIAFLVCRWCLANLQPPFAPRRCN